MNPLMVKWLGGGLIVVMLASSIYFKGRSDGKEKWKGILDEQRLVWQEAYDKQAAETARVQAEWDATKERESEIKERLDSVTADAGDLATRLRDYSRRRSCAVSSPAIGSPIPDAASGIPADSDPVEVATGEHFAACARDSERLTQFQQFYQSLRDAQ